MEHTVSKHGKIDYLVNNGGGQFRAPVSGFNSKGWNAVVDTNLNGTFYCLKHGGYYLALGYLHVPCWSILQER